MKKTIWFLFTHLETHLRYTLNCLICTKNPPKKEVNFKTSAFYTLPPSSYIRDAMFDDKKMSTILVTPFFVGLVGRSPSNSPSWQQSKDVAFYHFWSSSMSRLSESPRILENTYFYFIATLTLWRTNICKLKSPIIRRYIFKRSIWVFPKILVPQNGWFISWKTLWTNGWFGVFSPYFWFNTHFLLPC